MRRGSSYIALDPSLLELLLNILGLGVVSIILASGSSGRSFGEGKIGGSS